MLSGTGNLRKVQLFFPPDEEKLGCGFVKEIFPLSFRVPFWFHWRSSCEHAGQDAQGTFLITPLLPWETIAQG